MIRKSFMVMGYCSLTLEISTKASLKTDTCAARASTIGKTGVAMLEISRITRLKAKENIFGTQEKGGREGTDLL